MTSESPHQDGRHDFDFLFGAWIVHNTRQTDFSPRGDTWTEFTTTCRAQPILGGLGNVDFFSFAGEEDKPGWEASTVRLFEPGANLWRIYWASSAYPGSFGPPMEGRFEGETGLFYGEEDYHGVRIGVRFIWTHEAGIAARWEQAYRFPGHDEWRPNWIMDLTRQPSS